VGWQPIHKPFFGPEINVRGRERNRGVQSVKGKIGQGPVLEEELSNLHRKYGVTVGAGGVMRSVSRYDTHTAERRGSVGEENTTTGNW